MARISWHEPGERRYETGIDRGVLYVNGGDGVPWNGIVSVEESPTGGSPKAYYVDGMKYLHLSAPEEYEATLSAFYSPPEFDACDGAAAILPGYYAMHSPRTSFGLTYRTKIGNDIDGDGHGYRIHIIYNALASPAGRSSTTITNEAEIEPISWDISARPALINGELPVSGHFVIDTTQVDPIILEGLEDVLYGNENTAPRLPLPDEILELSNFIVIDNGDGTFTVSGMLQNVRYLTEAVFELSHVGVHMIDDEVFKVSDTDFMSPNYVAGVYDETRYGTSQYN